MQFVVCSGAAWCGCGPDSTRHFEGIELFPARHLLEQYGLKHDEDHKYSYSYRIIMISTFEHYLFRAKFSGMKNKKGLACVGV